MKLASLLLAFLLALHLSPSFADETPRLGARQLYDRGIAHYKIGEFEQAIVDFKAAYATEPSSVLLFNLAQAHRQLGDDKRALFFYRAFVRETPPSPARADAEQMIADLESKQPHRAIPTQTPTQPAVAAAPVDSGLAPHHAGLDRRGAIALVASTAAIGTALVIVGGGLSLHSSRVSGSLEDLTRGTAWSNTLQSRYDDGHRSANAAAAMYVIGGSAIAASVISALLCRKLIARDRVTAQTGGLTWAF